MKADADELRRAGREAVERRDWDAAYDLLSGLEAPEAEDLELAADAALWSRHYGDVIELLERATMVVVTRGEWAMSR